MKYDAEYIHSLPRKYAVCKIDSETEERLYWNIRDRAWVSLDAERYPVTLFDTFGEAQFLAQRMQPVARVASIHMDHR